MTLTVALIRDTFFDRDGPERLDQQLRAARARGLGLRLGIQICSDINRPEGSLILGGSGAEAIVNPRATEAATFDRWKTVMVATALTSGAYVLSVPRPREEFGVPLGGPSFAVAPTGEVLSETTETMALLTLDRAIVQEARRRYPGYLASRADLYADGWRGVRTTRLPHESHVSEEPS